MNKTVLEIAKKLLESKEAKEAGGKILTGISGAYETVMKAHPMGTVLVVTSIGAAMIGGVYLYSKKDNDNDKTVQIDPSNEIFSSSQLDSKKNEIKKA